MKDLLLALLHLAVMTAAHDDPEFGEVVTKQERDPATKLIIKAHNVDTVPSGIYTSIKITQ